MKVVTRQELLRMPAGTVYHPWESSYFGEMSIKGETLGNDWFEQTVPWLATDDSDIYSDALQQLDEGAECALDLQCEGRWCLFDDGMRYAVWSRDDVRALHTRLGAILQEADE